MIGIAQMESKLGEVQDCMIDEVWCAAVIIAECSESGTGWRMLVCICRVKANIQFTCATFELVD